eukprot:Em0021g429a
MGIISSETGVQRGDPLGPMFFCLVLHKLAIAIVCSSLLFYKWLNLYLDPAEFQTAVEGWLGIAVTDNSFCPFCPSHASDPLGHQALTCKQGRDVVSRHSRLRMYCNGLCLATLQLQNQTGSQPRNGTLSFPTPTTIGLYCQGLLSNCSNLLCSNCRAEGGAQAPGAPSLDTPLFQKYLDTLHPTLEVGHISKGQLRHHQVASHLSDTGLKAPDIMEHVPQPKLCSAFGFQQCGPAEALASSRLAGVRGEDTDVKGCRVGMVSKRVKCYARTERTKGTSRCVKAKPPFDGCLTFSRIEIKTQASRRNH